MDEPLVNAALWPSWSSFPTASPFRTKEFWLQVCLPQSRSFFTSPNGGYFPYETRLSFRFPASGQTLVLVVGSHDLALTLAAKDGVDALLGFDDGAHPFRVVFRWSEAVALGEHLELADRAPGGPSMALLLLAPYVAVTTFDEVGLIEEQYRNELGRLGLLSDTEVDEATRRLLAYAHAERTLRSHGVDTSNFTPYEWKRDQGAWRLFGGRNISERRPTDASSRRTPDGDFPHRQFVALLREAGIEDV